MHLFDTSTFEGQSAELIVKLKALRQFREMLDPNLIDDPGVASILDTYLREINTLSTLLDERIQLFVGEYERIAISKSK